MSAANYYSMLIFFTTIWRRLHCYTSSTTTEDINSMHWLLKGSDIIRPNLAQLGHAAQSPFLGRPTAGPKMAQMAHRWPTCVELYSRSYSGTPLRTGVLQSGGLHATGNSKPGILTDLYRSIMTVHIRYGTLALLSSAQIFSPSLYERVKRKSLSLSWLLTTIVFRTKPSRSHEFSPYLLYTNRR